jgi:hypothetical protein
MLSLDVDMPGNIPGGTGDTVQEVTVETSCTNAECVLLSGGTSTLE